MKLLQLRYLVEVYRHGNHISNTAEALHTSQPGISRQIQLIEEELGFPVFARNRYDVERAGQLDFDLQLFLANWPAARAYPWKTLLRARAIENLCYVAAVNRAGTDGNGLEYSGDSAVIDFLGQPVAELPAGEGVVTSTISAEALVAHREKFPAMLDADRFELR